MSSFFDQSSAVRHVSEETKRLCREGASSKLPRRDPAMYGDHHKCNKCDAQAKYISKDTHWCNYCLDTENYPHLAGLTQEQRDIIKAENLAKIGLKSGHSLMRAPEEYGKVGF